MPNDYDDWISSFTTQYIDVDGTLTAVYSAPQTDSTLPTILFVHGLNGDYHGLIPLSYELREASRAIFVDLPGHGRTAIPSNTDMVACIRGWGEKVLGALHDHGVDISLVVGHSFGTLAVQVTGAKNMVLINPPFETSSLSKNGSALLIRTGSITSKVFRSYPGMVSRGQWLMYKRTEMTDAIIAWSSHLTHVTEEQFKFQTQLGIAVSVQGLMNVSLLAATPRLLIILSSHDTVVNNKGVPVEQLPNARIVTIATGHVSVFEMPREIADEIRTVLN